jgi:hypothetical protein
MNWNDCSGPFDGDASRAVAEWTEDMTVLVVPYSPDWVKAFAQEAKVICRALPTKSRFPSLEAFGRRHRCQAASHTWGHHPKPFT